MYIHVLIILLVYIQNYLCFVWVKLEVARKYYPLYVKLPFANIPALKLLLTLVVNTCKNFFLLSLAKDGQYTQTGFGYNDTLYHL